MYNPEWEEALDTLPQGIFFSVFMSAFVAAALFFALLYRDWTMTLFTLILLIMALGLRIWRRLAVKALKFSVIMDKERVFPGERIDLQVRAVNRKFLPVFVKILVSLPESLTGQSESPKDDSKAGGLLWFQEMVFHRNLRPRERGLYAAGSVRLLTGDYFGFFPKRLGDAAPADILVFPPVIPVEQFSVVTRMLFGKKAKSSPIHDPVHILGTRDYRGDSPARNIHWKASARHNRLQEKIYDMTEGEEIFMMFDGEGFVNSGDRKAFEHAISVIGSLALLLYRNHYTMGFMTNCFVKARGAGILMPENKSGFLSILFETLAKIDYRTVNSMKGLLEKEDAGPGRNTCLYFSYDPVEITSFTDNNRSFFTNIISHKPDMEHLRAEPSGTALCYIEDICQVNPNG